MREEEVKVLTVGLFLTDKVLTEKIKLTFLMLKPTVFQIILNTTFKFFWVIVANQDRNKGIQGIKSFLEKKKDKDIVIIK